MMNVKPGKVDVSLPADTRADTRATTRIKSDRGEMFTDFDMKVGRQTPEVEQTATSYWVQIDAWTLGHINGGAGVFVQKLQRPPLIHPKAGRAGPLRPCPGRENPLDAKKPPKRVVASLGGCGM